MYLIEVPNEAFCTLYNGGHLHCITVIMKKNSALTLWPNVGQPLLHYLCTLPGCDLFILPPESCHVVKVCSTCLLR